MSVAPLGDCTLYSHKLEFQPMAQFKKEGIIPLINVTRKLLSCNLDQQVQVLPQLARIFSSDELSLSLMDILVTGLLQQNVHEKITAELYEEIQSILPSDKLLNLEDSVYESRLVETPDNPNEDQQSIKKRKKLPLTLVRIPTDLQCHIFHYLHYKDLVRVQHVCRALCIAARNPSAIYQLPLNFHSTENHHFLKQCYSQPRSLEISSRGNQSKPSQPLIVHSEWSQQVVDLRIKIRPSKHLVWKRSPFHRLKKYEVWYFSNLRLNGAISSDETLRELTLGEMAMTNKVIDQIRNFQNLKTLSLHNMRPNRERQESDPILLPKLETLSVNIWDYGCGFLEFQRILIGSHPKTINIESISGEKYDNVALLSLIAIPDILPIQQLNIKEDYTMSFSKVLCIWLRGARNGGRKLFDKTNVMIDLEEFTSLIDKVPSSIIPLFRYSRRTNLELKCVVETFDHCFVAEFVDEVCNAPFGTFTEIKMDIRCAPLWCGTKHGINYLNRMGDTLDDRKCSERDHAVVRRIFMETIDDVDEWMEKWLVFDEVKMKQIGLRTLNITLECNMDRANLYREKGSKEERVDHVLEGICCQTIQERIGRWNQIGRQCIKAKAAEDKKEYKVTFSLCV